MSSTETNAVLKEYGKLARHYDARWAFHIEATLGETLSRFKLQAGESLLDVGCGTGLLLKALWDSMPETHLSGADPSAEMLEEARKRLGEAVFLKQSPAESLAFPDQAFDVVVSTNSFHYFRQPLAALKEIRRVLRPSGRIVITDWCDDYLTSWLCDRFLRLFNRGHFRAYGRKEFSALLLQAGFTEVRIDRYKINWLWGLMTALGKLPDNTSNL